MGRNILTTKGSSTCEAAKKRIDTVVTAKTIIKTKTQKQNKKNHPAPSHYSNPLGVY